MNNVDNEQMKNFQFIVLELWVLEIGVRSPWSKGCEARGTRGVKPKNISDPYFYLLNPNFSYLFSCQNPSFLFLWFESDCDPLVSYYIRFFTNNSGMGNTGYCLHPLSLSSLYLIFWHVQFSVFYTELISSFLQTYSLKQLPITFLLTGSPFVLHTQTKIFKTSTWMSSSLLCTN